MSYYQTAKGKYLHILSPSKPIKAYPGKQSNHWLPEKDEERAEAGEQRLCAFVMQMQPLVNQLEQTHSEEESISHAQSDRQILWTGGVRADRAEPHKWLAGSACFMH